MSTVRRVGNRSAASRATASSRAAVLRLAPAVLAAWTTTACSGEPQRTPDRTGGCVSSQAPLSCTRPTPSYANDVVPLLDRDCNTSACHAVGGPAWPLVNYGDVSAWSLSIRDDVETCAMPPADAGVLPASDRQVLLDWIACGAPND